MRTSRISHILFFLLLFSRGIAHGDPTDTLRTTSRAFSPEVVTTLKADPAMNYGEGRPALSLWEQIKLFFSHLIEQLFDSLSGVGGLKLLVEILAVLALIYVILRLFHIDALGFFRSNRKAPLMSPAPTEDIRRMDFESLISAALQNGDYRQATRLRFLHALRLLSDNHQVTWHPGKTNYEYAVELRSKGVAPMFARLSRYFEYAWYGNFTIESQDYQQVDQVFNDLKKAML